MYALILAGGRGERLRPLTDSVPKPMVPLDGKPILHHQVNWLIKGGITDIAFLAGYQWEVIRDYFGGGQPFGFNAIYSVEDTPLGRGGAIRKGMASLPPDADPIVVVNGDVITDMPIGHLIARYYHELQQRSKYLGTITVVPFQSPFGIVDVTVDDRVAGFREKVELPFWINAGIYVLSRRIEEHMPALGDHETETFPALAEAGLLTAYRCREYWRSIDSFKDLSEAEEHLAASR